MKSRIENFFINSAKVLIDPDTLFKEKEDGQKDYEGIVSLIFYVAILGLLIGMETQSAVITILLILVSIIGLMVFKLIHCGLTYLFAMIFKGKGKFSTLYNLMCYEYVTAIILIIGMGLFAATGKFFILIPILLLEFLMKTIITVSAVNNVYKFGYGKSFLSAYGILILIGIVVGLLL